MSAPLLPRFRRRQEQAEPDRVIAASFSRAAPPNCRPRSRVRRSPATRARLRGTPILARGVTGAIPGTQPHSALVRAEHQRQRHFRVGSTCCRRRWRRWRRSSSAASRRAADCSATSTTWASGSSSPRSSATRPRPTPRPHERRLRPLHPVRPRGPPARRRHPQPPKRSPARDRAERG